MSLHLEIEIPLEHRRGLIQVAVDVAVMTSPHGLRLTATNLEDQRNL